MSPPVPAVVPAAGLPELIAEESEAMLPPSEPEPLVLLVLALSRLLPHPPSSEAPRAKATRDSKDFDFCILLIIKGFGWVYGVQLA
jgi:hypothetical protein